ncbi:MAG: hypothetical protein HUU54_17405 [Ignavibacteriaceae bacterium]|nr:hypothetical protein [Ignavibacteriaceae bacterium]
MKKYFFIIVLLVSGLTFLGCEKEESNPTGGGGNNNNTNPSGQPMPSFDTLANYNGTLATIYYSTTIMGFSVDQAMAFASFGTNGVDAGTVSVNGNNIPATAAGSSTYYMIPSAANPTQTLSGVNFNGSNHTWSIGGSANVSAFNASVTSVSNFNVTYPVSTTTHSKSSSLAVNWNNGNSNNKVMIVLTGTSGTGTYMSAELSDNGSYTIPSSSLSGFSGQVLMQVVKYRYSVAASGGKSYVLISEVVKQVTFTIN